MVVGYIAPNTRINFLGQSEKEKKRVHSPRQGEKGSNPCLGVQADGCLTYFHLSLVKRLNLGSDSWQILEGFWHNPYN